MRPRRRKPDLAPRRRVPDLEPALFNYIRDYAIDVIEASKKRSVPEVPLGPLTVFIDNFFGQFFRSALSTRITDFSDASHEKAVKIRLQLEKENKREEVVALVSSYETYCRLHPDIEQERSVPDEDESLDEVRSVLLESFLPDLLDRIEAWAVAAEIDPIAEAARHGREHLETAKVELGYE